ncbi:MAG: single-stranded-DNA-specific exonuclease RecJ [Streptococcaceae bacterium]|nr:single-stranded-DNA-specific exonuclease RecJ [Streptococcaceae bacterium]
MKEATYTWELKKKALPSIEFLKTLKQEKLSPLIGEFLWQRGIQTTHEMQKFLHPQLEDLHDPFLFFDMQRTAKRIKDATTNNEKILLYGDYDADGMTGVTLLKEALESIGAKVSYYLPNRFTDGYGPNIDIYKYFIKQQKVQLIITVDNGVTGIEAIDYAQKMGVDVIITDHHELPKDLPKAYALIHPKHPKGNYPFKELAGVGVAFKLACALLGEVSLELLDLVAIGTIADMVPLIDENRILTFFGLKTIRCSQRIGLIELMKIASIDQKAVTEDNVSFWLAPRFNALGRLKDPNPAVELLSTFDFEVAETLAKDIQKINEERKKLVEKIVKEAMEVLLEQPEDAIQIIAKTNWNTGVLGIVASRILKKTGKPTFVFAIDEKGKAKGSARSVKALNLFSALDAHRDLFLSFGGHHMAVGATLLVENLDKLRQILKEYIISEKIDLRKDKILKIDSVLTSNELTLEFAKELKMLAPFGRENDKLIFSLKNPYIQDVKTVGINNQHLKLTHIEDDLPLDIMAWGLGPLAKEFISGGELSIAGEFTLNEWNGQKKAQFTLTDFAVEGVQFFDLRGKQGMRFLPTEKALFLLNHKKNLKFLTGVAKEDILFLPEKEKIITWKKENASYNLVIVDIPDDAKELQQLVQESSFDRVYFLGLSLDEAYIEGMGSREQFAMLFKFIKQYRKVDIRHKFRETARYLKLPVRLFIFMVKVFEELDFVTIVNGVMEVVDKPVHRSLTESILYQKRKKQIEQETFFLLNDSKTLMNWFYESKAKEELK